MTYSNHSASKPGYTGKFYSIFSFNMSLAMLLASIVFVILLLSPQISLPVIKTDASAFPSLSENIEEIESLLGEYNDYYIVADAKFNVLEQSIAGAELQTGDIKLIVPEDTDVSDIILTFYTCWDEELKSYRCDFVHDPIYTVKGKDISVTKSDLEFVYIDIDDEELAKVDSSFVDGIPKYEADCNISIHGFSGSKGSIPAIIKPRGASSWTMYHRHPYSIKFAKKADYFGFGKEKKYNKSFPICRTIDFRQTG